MREHYAAPEIDASLLSCLAAPAVLDPETLRANPQAGSLIATYMVDDHEAGEDCRQKHKAVVGIILDAQRRAEELNRAQPR